MVKREDLAERKDSNYKSREDEYLYCSVCECRFSANVSDYWFMKMEEVLICGECDNDNLELCTDVINRIVIHS